MTKKEKKSETSNVKRELIEMPGFSHELIKDKLKVIYRPEIFATQTANHINVVQPLFGDIAKFYWEGGNNRYFIVDFKDFGELFSRMETMFLIYREYTFVFEINIPVSGCSLYFNSMVCVGHPALATFVQPFLFNDQLYEHCPFKY